MRKFSSARLEYLLVPDEAENSSVLDKAENPLVADKDKNAFVPFKIDPDNDANFRFSIPVCIGEYWGVSNPVCARFPQSQNDRCRWADLQKMISSEGSFFEKSALKVQFQNSLFVFGVDPA